MKWLTFAVTSSPFLATETLCQVARDYGSSFPLAPKVVLNEFYVNDVLKDAQSLKEAQELRCQLSELLNEGKFLLRKWRSNSAELLHTIPDVLKETDHVTELNLPKDCLKTLGIHWDTHQDILQVFIPDVTESNELTKQKLVSNIAKIYDIMDWFAPVIFYVKILL